MHHVPALTQPPELIAATLVNAHDPTGRTVAHFRSSPEVVLRPTALKIGASSISDKGRVKRHRADRAGQNAIKTDE